MKLLPQISFRNMPESEALTQSVLERVERLDKFFPRIMACRAVIEAPHRHHHSGNLFKVRVDLTVPGKEIVVGRGKAKHGAHKDAYVAIRDAFDAAERQLQDFARQVRGNVKSHSPRRRAQVSRIFPKDGYGFLTGPEGQEVYFHEHSLINKPFDTLEVGEEVRMVEEMGKKGPQASTVEVKRRREKTPANWK